MGYDQNQFFLIYIYIYIGVWQNGTSEEVKKIVSTLNQAEVPSEDVVGKSL